jgi:hypothetical protein
MQWRDDMTEPMGNNLRICCPVCGGTLCSQLPNRESVVEERIYEIEDVRIIASEVIVECTFDHFTDEDEGFALENPHPLVITFRLVFDTAGGCTQFDYQGIRPGYS